jgi:aminodeoxyfutalosine deaminase
MTYPKIELHVHLEGAVQPATLLAIATRNSYPMGVETAEELSALFRYRDFDHFMEVWTFATNALQRYDDFRQIVVDYARSAAEHGAVYIEAIFSPVERAWRGVPPDVTFSGYCDGAQQAAEETGVEVRLTPDITRGASLEDALEAVRYAAKYRDRGVVGIGLGGEEDLYPPERFEPVFLFAKDIGLGSVPHAGEVVGPASIWGALRTLRPDRIRHGVRAIEDPFLVEELGSRGTMLDVCPISNLRTGVIHSLEEHPLPDLLAAGVRCSVSTDDPAMFDTDLSREYAAVEELGIDPRTVYETAIDSALCDDEMKERLRRFGNASDWN